MLHSICQQIPETQQWPQDWKRLILFPVPKKGSTKECAKHRTVALICHASKVMLKILHARLQHYANQELPVVQVGFRKGRETRDQIADMRWIIEKARNSRKTAISCFIDYAKVFDCVDHNKLGKAHKEMEIPDHLTCLLRNLYTGQEATVRTMHGLRLRKEYNRAVCCHPVCLTYTLSTSWEMLGWMSYILESRYTGETATTSDMRWCYSNGRKRRRTKEPLDEGEGGEWKSQLKTKY